MECEDFLQFQDMLRKMRDVDDKIIYILNASLPTPSFKPEIDPSTTCKQIHGQLDESYERRASALNKCIHRSAEEVKTLKEMYETNENDFDLVRKLKKEQNRLRMLKTEVNVEEVLKQRTMKVFQERCRNFYKPASSMNL